MEKFTKKNYHEFVITLVRNAMESEMVSQADGKIVIDKAKAELELLEKKKNADNKKKAEKSADDKALAEKVLDILANATDKMTVTDILKSDADLMAKYSNQKITNILKSLVAEEKVINDKSSRKSVYSISLSEDFPNEPTDEDLE